MPTLAAGSNSPLSHAQRGWTLLELLVVLGILALVLGMVVQSIPPADQRRLQRESAKLLAHLDAARSNAMVQARPVWLVPTPSGWGLRHSPQGPDWLHQEVWDALGLQITIATSPTATPLEAMRIGPDPVMPMYELHLRHGERSVVLHNPTMAGFEVKPKGQP